MLVIASPEITANEEFNQFASRTMLAVHVMILIEALIAEYVRWRHGMGNPKAGPMVLTPDDR